MIASVFITGAGIDGSFFRFYWYYPVYVLFILLGILSFKKVERGPLLVLVSFITFALITHQSDLPLVAKQLINVSFSWTVFYFLIVHENKDILALFDKYVRVAKVLAILGLIQVVLFLIGSGKIFLSVFPWLKDYDVSTRLQSLTQEPSYIAFTFSPIVFCALYNLFYSTHYFMSRWWSVVFIVVYLLTQSTIAYLGLIVMLLLIYFRNFSYRKLQFLVFFLFSVVVICAVAYRFMPGVRLRIDDTRRGLSSDFFRGDMFLRVNPSTYAILSNYYVTVRAFEENPILGNGFGTYEAQYDKQIPNKVRRVDRNYLLLNRQDAASMGFRLLAETGLVGILLFLFFVWHYKCRRYTFYSSETDMVWMLNSGIFVLIMLALLRNGNYTVHGKILFLFLYYYSFLQWRRLMQTGSRPNTEDSTTKA